MTTIEFLAEWALRSSVLILAGALLLRALRVKDASVRLAAWAALLCGSLAIPALTAALPRVPMMAAPPARVTVDAPAAAGQMASSARGAQTRRCWLLRHASIGRGPRSCSTLP